MIGTGCHELTRSHAREVERFIRIARQFNSAAWILPPAPGKWSPAEIVQHVTITYETLNDDLAGSAAMRVRTKRWQRIFLRTLILPVLLRTGFIPRGVSSPEELIPNNCESEQEPLFARLRDGAQKLELALKSAPHSTCITHPLFGRLRPPQAIRFITIHTRHHGRQLERIVECEKEFHA